MEQFLPILKKTKLFSGVDADEISSMFSCLGASLRFYKKGEFVLRQGERVGGIMVLAEGNLHIQSDDYWGNRSILGEICAGEMFGEAYAAAESCALPNDVVAVTDSAVLRFDVNRILTTCSSGCRFHTTVVQNLFFAISEKNRKLVQKLGIMSKRTTREKLISYLSEQSKKQNSASFSIPFNRRQLADFLSVDRSALSNELCRMRDEGMIKFEKNRFILL